MATCDGCKKSLGMLSVKHKHSVKGEEILLCDECNTKKEGQDKQKEEKTSKERLKINSQWEYKVVHLKKLDHPEDLEKRLTSEILNKYGEDGWELVNVVSPTINSKLATNLMIVPIALVFKRKMR